MKLLGLVAAAVCAVVPGAALAHDEIFFVGEVYATVTNFCPVHTLPADGYLVPYSAYWGLGRVIGNRYGGDGKETIGLPKIAGGAPGQPETRWCIAVEGRFPQHESHGQ